MTSRYSSKKNHPGCWFLSLILILSACRPVAPTGTPVEGTALSPTQNVLPTTTADATQTLERRPTQTPTLSPSPTLPPTSTLEVDASDLQGVTLQFWHPWSGETGRVVGDIVAEFNRTNEWGIRAEASYEGNYDGLDQKIRTALQEDSPPDLVLGFTHQVQGWESGTEQGNGNAQAQKVEPDLLDLQPYANDPIWGWTQEEQNDFYPAFWEGEVAAGRRLGIPALRSAQVLYYNLSWARELGYESPPATPDDFRQQACAAAQANNQDESVDNDRTGGWMVTTDYAAITGWMQAFGAEITNPAQDGYRFDSPEVEETFRFLRGLYDEGCAWIPESEPPEGEFAARLGLFMDGSIAGIAHQAVAFERAENGDQWTVIPFPSRNGDPVISAYGPAYAILRSEPERQLAAWLLAKWLAMPENQAQLAIASGSYPTRQSARVILDTVPSAYPQWAEALDFIRYATQEPALQSWNTVRWAVSDAATQLFRYYFTIDQVPVLVELLDETAQELHLRFSRD